MKVLFVGENKVGKRFAIVKNRDAGLSKPGLFSVFAECSNYAAHLRGGISKTWRLDKRDLPLEEATKIFDRRIAGREKP